MSSRKDGVLGLYLGYTRSGKSTPIKEVAIQNERVLVSDVKGEYGALGFEVIETRSELLNTLREKTGAAKIAFLTRDKNDFEFFCACAFNWNRQKECLVITEELAMCTNAGKAGGYWGVLVNQSLGFGITLLATAQRGQEIDKTIIGAASYMHIAQQGEGRDGNYIAGETGINPEYIPVNPLEFIVYRRGKGLLIRNGQIVYKSKQDKKPKFRGIKHGSNRSVSLAIQKNGLFKGVNYF